MVTAAGSVTQPTVRLGASAAGAKSSYDVDFQVSGTGALDSSAGSDVKIVFPTGTGLNTLSGSSIMDVTQQLPVGGNCSQSGLTVTCSITGSVLSGDALDVTIDGITNPSTAASDTVKVSSSSDTTQSTSGTYPISSASQVSSVVVDDAFPSSAAGALTDYSVSFAVSGTGALDGSSGSSVSIAFPSGTGFGSLGVASAPLLFDSTTQ
jgi:hypothetical protein